MARGGETYVQGHLFGPLEVVANVSSSRRTARGQCGRVTRDPAVAQAHEEAHRHAHGVKLGLARVLATRSPEERAAIRQLLTRPHVA